MKWQLLADERRVKALASILCLLVLIALNLRRSQRKKQSTNPKPKQIKEEEENQDKKKNDGDGVFEVFVSPSDRFKFNAAHNLLVSSVGVADGKSGLNMISAFSVTR